MDQRPLRPGWERAVGLVIMGLVTGAVLIFAIYLILSKGYADDTEKWATGIIGTVLGFWMNQFGRLLP